MIMWSLPSDALEDPFRPPDEPVQVRCLHCGQEYSSDQIVWRKDDDDPQGFWCCPIEGCDGMGFQFDIHPVDSDLWIDDDEDDLADDAPAIGEDGKQALLDDEDDFEEFDIDDEELAPPEEDDFDDEDDLDDEYDVPW